MISLITIISSLLASAQDLNVSDSITIDKTTIKQDSVLTQNLYLMSTSYYNSKLTLERDYNFELYNKQRRMKMWSNEILLFGYACVLGVYLGGGLLFPDISLWVLIPSESVVASGIIVGSTIWAKNVRNKAGALRESIVSMLNVNDRMDLYLTYYSTEWYRNTGFGIGFKCNF